eukprot:SAG31_NODE_141_length_22675_cov_48.948879_22_plen_310_part_00
MEGALEAKNREIVQLKAELQDSVQQRAMLKQVENAKEARLLKEQNSKLQRELTALRSSTGPNPAPATNSTVVLRKQLAYLRQTALSMREDCRHIHSDLRQWGAMASELRQVADQRVAIACLAMTGPGSSLCDAAGHEVLEQNRHLSEQLSEAKAAHLQLQTETDQIRAENTRLHSEAFERDRHHAPSAEQIVEGERELSVKTSSSDTSVGSAAAQHSTKNELDDVTQLRAEIVELKRRLDSAMASHSAHEAKLKAKAEMDMASFDIERKVTQSKSQMQHFNGCCHQSQMQLPPMPIAVVVPDVVSKSCV